MSSGPEDNKPDVCAHCGSPFTVPDRFCASCGRPRGARVRTTAQPQKIVLLIGVVGLLIILIVIGAVTVPDSENTTNQPATSSQELAFASVTCRTCPGPGTNVMVKFAGNSQTSETIEGYVSEAAYRKFLNIVNSADKAAVFEGTVRMFRLGEWVGISNRSRAEVIKSVRFTTDPHEESPWWNGICVRILEGSCDELASDTSARLIAIADKDCRGRVLWVNSVFVSADSGEGRQNKSSNVESSSAKPFRFATALAGPPALDLNRDDNGPGRGFF